MRNQFVRYSLSLAAGVLTPFCASQVMALDPAEVKVGALQIIPTLTMKERYDTNIFSQPENEKKSWVTILSPEVEAEVDLDTITLLGSYRHTAGLYDNSSNDNYYDNRAVLGMLWEANHRNFLDLKAIYNDSHEDRGTGFSQGAAFDNIDEPDTYEEYLYDLNYRFGGKTAPGRLLFNLGDYSKEFTNHREITQGRDREELRGGMTFLWRVGGRTELLAEVRHREINYLNDPAANAGTLDTLDSSATRYLLGVSWDVTGKTEGSVKVGHSRKDFDDSDRSDFSGASWELGFKWYLKSYSVLSLDAERAERETDGTGSFIDAKAYQVNWQHDWTERLSSTIFYRFDDESYEDANGRQDEADSYGVRIDYGFRRWLDLGVSVVGIEKDSNAEQFQYDREQLTFHFAVSL